MSHTSPRGRIKDKRTRWIAGLFSSYYRAASLELPEDMRAREFAYQPLGSKTYVRHLSFKSEDDVREYFSKNPPLHLYYSSALYAYPEIPDMEQKKWLGSNLIFDIDADHLVKCRYMEQLHVCLDCGYLMRGSGIKKCPRCGSPRVAEAEPVPQECIRLAGREALKLVRVLDKELGLKNAKIYFSGNRGFHVHVECDEECLRMSSEDRRELVDYLKGVGLDLSQILLLGEGKRMSASTVMPSPSDPGWRGRLGGLIYDRLGLPPDAVITYREFKDKIGETRIEDLLDEARIEIDEKVTIDIHRLVRIPGSLHGKTGLPVISVPESSISDFSIDCRISPLKGRTLVKLNVSLQGQRIMGHKIDAGKNDVIDLPHCLALFLVLKGIADPL